jgi:crotonobetainyl-CoA:carnitine CoA-transferase CaiB-like acyl-CoA transferase
MPARDGWCALTLSRRDDVDAVPALLRTEAVGADPWPAIRRWVADTDAADVADRARLLGLPVAVLGEAAAAPPCVRPLGPPGPSRPLRDLLVVDLSAMWAGPLCGHLLARAGATVVKVETAGRPDGARFGPPSFFDWMNSEKLAYKADFGDTTALHRLMALADVVIESSRPSALARRGLGATDVAARAGLVWVRITGHGADGERANWVAFGDDAAVSGGLVRGTTAAPEFCGDAIADPLTGLRAATAVVQSLARGGGHLIDVAMAAEAATYAELPRTPEIARDTTPIRTSPAAALGADNARVERLLAGQCAC